MSEKPVSPDDVSPAGAESAAGAGAVVLRPMPSRLAIGFNVVLQVFLVLLLFVGVNYVGFHYYKRWDLTPAGSHTLSSSTLGYLRKLSKEVEIAIVYPRDAPQADGVRALLEEYRRHGKRLVKLEQVDSARDVERMEQLKVETGLTLAQNGILIRANKRQRYLLEEELEVRDPRQKEQPVVGYRVEDAVTSALVGLIEGRMKKLYLLVGKGAREAAVLEGAGETLAEISRQQNFELAVLNLASVERVPEDAAGLLVIGPQYDLSEREVSLVREYWGGERAGLLVLLDPLASTPRLNAFLTECGVRPRGDRVLAAQSTSAGLRKEFSVEVGFSRESLVTLPLADALAVLTGQTQSLELAEEGDDRLVDQGLVVTPLVRAAERFWGEVDYLDAIPVADAADGDTLPPVDVGAAVERGVVTDERLRVESSRMVVLGNVEVMHPQRMVAECRDLVAGSLNWMVSRERLIGITAKPRQAYRVQLNERQSQVLFALTTFAMPGLALMLGWFVWLSRRSA